MNLGNYKLWVGVFANSIFENSLNCGLPQKDSSLVLLGSNVKTSKKLWDLERLRLDSST